MNLWIRSQNKEILKLAEYLDIYDDSVEEQCWVIEESGTDLGKYKSKERAIEVIDEIENILKPKYILNNSSIKPDGNSWVENGIILQKYNTNTSLEESSTYVYEMPNE